jgi:hypothetical protein
MPYAAVFAAVLRAGAAGVSGNERVAGERLHLAIRLGEETEMLLHAAAARRALGALLGGDMGRDLVRRADEAMEAQGVRAPARFAAMLVPGYARRS